MSDVSNSKSFGSDVISFPLASRMCRVTSFPIPSGISKIKKNKKNKKNKIKNKNWKNKKIKIEKIKKIKIENIKKIKIETIKREKYQIKYYQKHSIKWEKGIGKDHQETPSIYSHIVSHLLNVVNCLLLWELPSAKNNKKITIDDIITIL